MGAVSVKGANEHRGAVAISANAALMFAAASALFFLPNVAVMAAIVLLSLTLALIGIFLAIVFDHGIPLRRARVALAGALVLSCLLLSFGGLYHDQSTLDRGAFSRPLDRVEAMYYAIGVVSTAGTNGVSARSQGARAELALQELTDVTLLALLVGGILNRLAPRRVPTRTHPRGYRRAERRSRSLHRAPPRRNSRRARRRRNRRQPT
jgi:hypothetical protein